MRPASPELFRVARFDQYSAVQFSFVQYSTAHRITAQHSTAQHIKAHYGTVRCSTAQHSRAQYGTVRYSAVRGGARGVRCLRDGGRIFLVSSLEQRYGQPAAMRSQLLHSAGSEGVAGGDHDLRSGRGGAGRVAAATRQSNRVEQSRMWRASADRAAWRRDAAALVWCQPRSRSSVEKSRAELSHVWRRDAAALVWWQAAMLPTAAPDGTR